eukprot:4355477-Pleurochrysis_carterae.AAC.2
MRRRLQRCGLFELEVVHGSRLRGVRSREEHRRVAVEPALLGVERRQRHQVLLARVAQRVDDQRQLGGRRLHLVHPREHVHQLALEPLELARGPVASHCLLRFGFCAVALAGADARVGLVERTAQLLCLQLQLLDLAFVQRDSVGQFRQIACVLRLALLKPRAVLACAPVHTDVTQCAITEQPTDAAFFARASVSKSRVSETSEEDHASLKNLCDTLTEKP